eukprot:GEZU01023544.1.p1 GENE.GEZU01023544.1~~GEZU01023544.1.p1  ORF type:complete len:270 (-),score=10.66 GEZU01023544.1:236-1045(-)
MQCQLAENHSARAYLCQRGGPTSPWRVHMAVQLQIQFEVSVLAWLLFLRLYCCHTSILFTCLHTHVRRHSEDMYAQDSIDLLTKSGIDFKKNEEHGIDVVEFGELMMASGIVLNPDVRWISFHSGYDFGYLLKILTCEPLPTPENEFFELLHTYFPCIYDIKYLMKSCENLRGGLNQLAEDLACPRIGPAHQAGSDSLLTCATFFKMMKMYFENNLDESKYLGVLYGLGQDHSLPPPPPEVMITNGSGSDKEDSDKEKLIDRGKKVVKK